MLAESCRLRLLLKGGIGDQKEILLSDDGGCNASCTLLALPSSNVLVSRKDAPKDVTGVLANLGSLLSIGVRARKAS